MAIHTTEKTQASRLALPDKVVCRIAQQLQNAKLHKTLARLGACSKKLKSIVKPILWQEVMWTKSNFKPAELFAKGRPTHFKHVRYIWLGSEGDGWFWKALFVHSPKELNKTFDELAHHFFPSLCFISEVGKPNPDCPSNDNVFNVWLSARNVLTAYDYNAMGRLLLGVWNRTARKIQYRGKVPRVLWELPELPSLHSNHDPAEWTAAANTLERRAKAKSGSLLSPVGSFKTTLDSAAVWREELSIGMGPIGVAVYINVLSARTKKDKEKGSGLLPHFTRLLRILNGLFFDQQKAMTNEWVQFELFFWRNLSENHPVHAWMEFMAAYEDPLEHRRPQPPFKVIVQILTDIGPEFQFKVFAVLAHLRLRTLRQQSPFHAERLPQYLDIVVDDEKLPDDMQWLFQADYSTRARADIMRYGHTFKGRPSMNLLALGLFQGNCEIASGRQMAEIMKRFDDWEPETKAQLAEANRPGHFTLEQLRGQHNNPEKENAKGKKGQDSSRPSNTTLLAD